MRITDRILTALNRTTFHREIFIILASALVVFASTLNNGFVWDDRVLMIPNEIYKTFDVKLIFFSKANSLEYLPFRDLTLAVDYQLWGMNPFGYHLSNLFFYLISLIALYAMVKNLVAITGEEQEGLIPFWTTLIFALHPLHVEAVNFIGGRNNILAGLFLFLSFNSCITGIREKKNVLIILSGFLFLISLFSKASVVFYPLFLAAVFFLAPGIRSTLKVKIMVFMLFCILDLIAIWVHLSNAAATATISEGLFRYGIYNPGVIISKALQIPFFYLKMLLLPYPLSIKYHVSFTTGTPVLYTALAGIYVLIAVFAVWAWKRKKILLLLSVIWFFLSLGPVLNILPTTPVVADRYAYLAVFGFALLMAVLLQKIIVRAGAFLLIPFGIIIIWSSIDVSRNTDWKSDISLWESAVETDPDIERRELAIAFWNEGQYDEALSLFKEDRERKGSYEYSLYQGRYFSLKGRFDNAIVFYKKALAEGGGALKETNLYLAQAYEMTGSYKLAMKYYLRVFDTKSLDPLEEYKKEAEQGLKRIRVRFEPRLTELRNIALNEPADFQAQLNTAIFLYDIGLYNESESFYLKSLNLDSSRWDVWHNLGILYMKLQRYDEAVNNFKRSLEIKSDNIGALNNIGISYMTLKDYDQAAQYFKNVLEQKPDLLYAAFSLGKIYFITGNNERSKEYFLKAKVLADKDSVLIKKIDQLLQEMQ